MSFKSSLSSCKVYNVLDMKSKRKREEIERFERVIGNLDADGNLSPVEISWEKGAVVFKRDGEEIDRDTQFKPINLKKRYISRGSHTGGWPWENCLQRFVTDPDFYGVYFQKHRAAYYRKLLGKNPKQFAKEYQACMFKAFIPESIKTIAQKYCRKPNLKRSWINEYVEQLNDKEEIILQCLKDGQENIIPFIIAQKGVVTPSELRKKIGKGMWKEVLKNSKSRNYLLVNWLTVKSRSSLEEANKIPSSILKCYRTPFSYDTDSVRLLKEKGILTKAELHRDIVITVDDTKDMYTQLERKLPSQSSKWDLDKWKERHDWCVEQINLKKYSKDKFEWMNNIQKEYTSSCGNYTATLLDNAYAIRNEGDKMKHCVGSYSDRVFKGNYLVWSLCGKDGKSSSTLGATIIKDNNEKKAVYNQHYKQCNSPVRCQNEEAFREELLKKINIQFKKEKL